jgi:hypothetical protein
MPPQRTTRRRPVQAVPDEPTQRRRPVNGYWPYTAGMERDGLCVCQRCAAILPFSDKSRAIHDRHHEAVEVAIPR